MKPLFITTSIAYPNAAPHVGYALEQVQADFFARYYRLMGFPVRYQTGIDVHGLKILRTAEKAGQTAEAFVADKQTIFEELAAKLNLSQDRFISTGDDDHIEMSQALWRRCAANGDIYKKTYRAWYNVKEEEFLGMVDDIPDPKTLGIDPSFIEMIDEENYFFALSRYKDQVVELLKSEAYKVFPKSRGQELLNFVAEKGLQDVSVSREKSKLPWGVPVPGDDLQVMYVWFDALTNYLTGSCTVENGEIKLGEYWPADLHCVGKDIARFHGLLWPGMLLSAGIELPTQLLVHGFLTSGGQKMSKSIGNVIDPLEMIANHGTDPVRWYLLKEVPTTGDADFTEARLAEVYTADLANDLGNLVSRVWSMCQKYTEGKVPTVTPEQVDNLERVILDEAWREYHKQVSERRTDLALRQAHSMLVFCNKRIDELKPWALAKDEDKRTDLEELLYELLEIIRQVTVMISPALPVSTQRIATAIFPNVKPEAWTSMEIGAEWGTLEPGSQLGSEALILFPKKEVA